MTITLKRSRIVLGIVWLIGFIVPLCILAAQTYVGTVYHGKEAEAWNWFSPNIVPTMGLIVATFAATTFGATDEDKPVSLSSFLLTLTLSVLYVAMFMLIFLLQPLTNSPPLEAFKRASWFLGIVQGLATTALGVFFIKNAKS